MAFTLTPFPAADRLSEGSPQPAHDDERCSISRQRFQWTLLGDCDRASPLDLPWNVTLDGGGHTITLTGDAEGFESAAVRANGGDIVNLTIDGSQLLPFAPTYFAAIALLAPGSVSNVTVRNLQFTDVPHCGIGIEVAAFHGSTAHVQDVQLDSISGDGLLLTGDGQVNLQHVTSSGVTIAVHATGEVSARLSETAVDAADVAILAQDKSRVRLDTAIAGGDLVVEDEARVHHSTLTFIGARDRERARQQASERAAVQRGRLG